VVVKSIINLGLTVVAEGVEDDVAWRDLAELGCDAAQGYHLARPMPGGDVTKWWRDWRAGHLLEAVPVAVGTAED
jgi:EAL domain-containing protein (putative c-di-GMP-specific phosphodiesterase class I)